MAIYAISFRIHDDSTRQDRYESLVDSVRHAVGQEVFWEETTSFFVIEYGGTADHLASNLVEGSSFAENKDLLLVIDLSDRGHAIYGNCKDMDIDDLLRRR